MEGPKVNISPSDFKVPPRKKRPVYKKKKCFNTGQHSVHNFNGQKPFAWQKCMCKRFTFGQLEELNRQGVEKEGAGI